jgi:exodeoxyribonuclease VII small subunit
VTFEDDLARLELIVRSLEQEQLPLADALRLFEEGVGRLRSASAALTDAEGRVRELVEDADGTLRVEPAA